MNEIRSHERARPQQWPQRRGHAPIGRRGHPGARISRHPARYPLVVAASVLLLLLVGIAHDRGHLDLALSLLAYAVVLAVIVLASRVESE